MSHHAFRGEQIKRCALQLVRSREVPAPGFVLPSEFLQLVPHRGPLFHELRNAGIIARRCRFLDRLAHVDNFTNLATAFHRNGYRQVPDIIGEIFKKSHRIRPPPVGTGRDRLPPSAWSAVRRLRCPIDPSHWARVHAPCRHVFRNQPLRARTYIPPRTQQV